MLHPAGTVAQGAQGMAQILSASCFLSIPFLRHLLSFPGAPRHIPSAVHRRPRSSWNPPPTPVA